MVISCLHLSIILSLILHPFAFPYFFPFFLPPFALSPFLYLLLHSLVTFLPLHSFFSSPSIFLFTFLSSFLLPSFFSSSFHFPPLITFLLFPYLSSLLSPSLPPFLDFHISFLFSSSLLLSRLSPSFYRLPARSPFVFIPSFHLIFPPIIFLYSLHLLFFPSFLSFICYFPSSFYVPFTSPLPSLL